MPTELSAAYISLVVGVVSFLGSLAAAAVGGYFTRWNEHEKWLRQERLQAYSKYLLEVNELHSFILDTWDMDPKAERFAEASNYANGMYRAALGAQGIVVFLGTQAVVERSRALLLGVRITTSTWPGRGTEKRVIYVDGFLAVRNEFVDAVRVEFGLAHDKSLGFPLDAGLVSSADTPD